MKARELKAGDVAILGFVIVRILEVKNLSGNITQITLDNTAKPITLHSYFEVERCDDKGNKIQAV